MNFFNAKLIKKNGYAVELDGKLFPFTTSRSKYLADNNAEEQDIVLGVRPEHIHVLKSNQKAADDAAYINAKVTVSEMMGSELYVHCTVIDGKEIIVRVPTIELTKEDRKTIEDCGNLKITFVPEVMHIFNKESEKNIIPIEVE